MLGHRLHGCVTILPNGPGMHAFQQFPRKATAHLEPVFACVENSQDENLARSKFVAEQVHTNAKLSDFSRIKLAQPRPSSRKFNQSSWRIRQQIESRIGCIETILRQKIMETIQVSAGRSRP
jgi:hypothetical protein